MLIDTCGEEGPYVVFSYKKIRRVSGGSTEMEKVYLIYNCRIFAVS